MKKCVVLVWDPWTIISLYRQSFPVMKSKKHNNKLKLSALLSSLDHGPNAIIDSKSDGNYNHDDTITSFVLQAATDAYGYKVIRILSKGIFVLVYWMFKARIKAVIQMKELEGKVLLINATYRAWPKVSQTSGHAFLTG